ncbi:MAG: tRNA (guanosine(37)-N1)-methyltransferase TrmD [Acidimicrobiia bacterium]|nr:tRNA (guanosine(37)-N1)-methyltransferase TrmD [Acidimicrobiia bacterium]NNL27564.1 tRNA (guanosine(37)-N1)-methyltransferase TrmD [Acidimicrobiia bacterium]
MQFNIITLFPEFFASPLRTSLLANAVTNETIDVNLIDLRHYGIGKHRQVDDAPFGGGAGMVLMVGPIADALADLPRSHRILLTPAGDRLTQDHLTRWSEMDSITLICGRYEGVDHRVAEHLVDEEVSMGDVVLMGGEVAALAIVEGVARLIPGSLGNPESPVSESFSDGLLEEPQYTRPARYDDWEVPAVLLSGDHRAVDAWRQSQRTERTKQRRPDLWEKISGPEDAEA